MHTQTKKKLGSFYSRYQNLGNITSTFNFPIHGNKVGGGQALQLSWASLAFYVNDLTGTEFQWLFDIQYVVRSVANMAGYAVWHGTPATIAQSLTL